MAAHMTPAREALHKELGITFNEMGRRLDQRVAIVTGAAQGIGRAIARRLALEGANQIITDLETQEDKLRALVNELREVGVQAEYVLGDATQSESIDAVCNLTLEKFKRVDILVNNVGGGVLVPFLQKTEAQWQAEIDRNLIPTLRYCQRVVPQMVKQRYGRVVMIGAESVRNGLWEHATYNAAKGGIHGLTTGLARELAPYTITVNTIAPSIVSTEVVQKLMAEGSEMANRYIGLIPMARPATLGEVAAAVAFAASDDASFITGQVISVNGGSSML
jgi:2,3-dihydroxy-2,3-dihydro-p-cumate dehydrogenase